MKKPQRETEGRTKKTLTSLYPHTLALALVHLLFATTPPTQTLAADLPPNQTPEVVLQTLHLQEISHLQHPNSPWRVEKTPTLKILNGKPHRLLLLTHKETHTTVAAWEDHISDTQTGTLFNPNTPKQEGEPLGRIQDGRIEILGSPPTIPTPRTTSLSTLQGLVGTPIFHQIQTDPPTQLHKLFRPPPFQGTWAEKTSPPPGLTFNKENGTLYGTPTQAGTYTYLINSTQLKKNIFQTQTQSTLTVQINSQ